MRRLARLVLALSILAGLTAPAAMAAERMWVGFHDDPSFRWVGNRDDRVRLSAQTNATIMRLLVQWNLAAKTRPSNPSNPFDPAYTFDDIDEAVRSAQVHDQEVILTISGTPRWANGGKNPNVMPRRLTDLTAFSRAIASRYSGRFDGYPFVRFFSVWNEPNLQLFLSPQFDARGRSVAPANYARMYAAAYSGIKLGNPRAQVAIGETSARGSDKPTGLRPTHTPGKFAELVAKANPRLKFDAWSHHPYPFNPNSPPSQRVKWPNVSLASLPQFNANLKKWFKRKSVPIWITEYGHQTKPPDSLGVSYSKQAAYIQQSMSMTARYPFVNMFIWFVFQDDPGQPWESGVYTAGGAKKGNVRSTLQRERATARRHETPSSCSTRHADPARESQRSPLLRERRARNPYRHDVASLPGQPPDCSRSADLAAEAGLHDQRPTSIPRRQGPDVHRNVRVERRERDRARPPTDHPRHLARPRQPSQTSTCIPSHHWGAPRSLPSIVRIRRARGCAAR